MDKIQRTCGPDSDNHHRHCISDSFTIGFGVQMASIRSGSRILPQQLLDHMGVRGYNTYIKQSKVANECRITDPLYRSISDCCSVDHR